MDIVKKVLSIIGVAVLGYILLLIVGYLADVLGYIPHVVNEDSAFAFFHVLFGFGGPLLMLFAALSSGYMFVSGSVRLWFLWLPVYGSVLYSLGVLLYFFVKGSSGGA